MKIPWLPNQVRRKLKDLECRNIEWDLSDIEEAKVFGYCDFGNQRIALTVALVTGKACIELLAPIHNEDVML